MAKHCDVCNHDYADDLSVCPHCAAAKKTQLASPPAEDRRTQLADSRPTQLGTEPLPSDSAIDLGHLPTSKPATGDAAGTPPASMSGVSAIDWSALAEKPPAEHLTIDSPSDADLLKHGAAESVEPAPSAAHEEIVGDLFAEPPAAPPASAAEAEAEVVDLFTAPPEPAASVSDSAVDFGVSPVELVEEGSGAILAEAPPSDSHVFMAELASDASKVDLVGDSGINLAGEEIVELASASDLGGISATTESPSGRDLIAEAVEAGIDTGTPEADLVEEIVYDAGVEVDEHSSAVDLGASFPTNIEAISAVSGEEIVELAESSGIDLESLSVPSASGSGSKVRAPSESSVDLGSQPDFASPAPSGEGLEAVVVEDSGIHLDGVSELAPVSSEASNLALESLLAESSSSRLEEATPPAEEPAALVEDEAVISENGADVTAVVDEEAAALAAIDEPVVSEAEVDDLLASLEEKPASAKDLATMAEDEAAASAIAEGDESVAEAESELTAENAAAVEEEAVAEEEDEEKSAKPVKPRSRIPALIGGTFVGLLLGAGGLIGARVGGFDVPALMGLGEQKKAAGPVAPQPPAMTPQTRAALVRNGDFEAAKASIESSPATEPDDLAIRGSYRLGQYLQKSGSKVNPLDPALQMAIEDLKKAAEAPKPNADAIYDLGLINELANKMNEARAEYTKGLQTSQDNPLQKRRFQSALDRLDLRASDKPPGAAFAPLPERIEDRVALLALLLIGLQQPAAPQPGQPPVPANGAPQAGGDEAGFDFWEAAKLARKGDFDKAMQALDKARTTHDQERFKRLRKAQNPLSDPTEDIFLRCCEELKQYWLLESNLRERNYLTDKNTAPDALKDLLKKADDSGEIVKSVTDKFIKEKIFTRPDEDVTKGVDRLIKEKKDAEGEVATLTTQLEKTTKEATDLAGKLKTAEDTIKDSTTKLKATAERELKLKAANDDLTATLKKITDALAAAKFLDPKGKPDVGEAVRQAVDLAKIKDPQGLIRTQRTDLAQMSASLKQRWRPEEMLPLWRTLLEQNRNRRELATKATIDVDRVKADLRATPGQNGEAQIVLGLALRNTEKFAEAKTVLQTARQAVDKGEWLLVADAALREVSDPAAYYAEQAQRLYDRGQMNAALTVLDRAMQVLPVRDQARLFAQRSLMELDAARSKSRGTIAPTEPLLIAARRDAAEAVKAGLAEGHYATGRIAEELGQWDSAIQSYRKAVDAHPLRNRELDAEGSRYRIALARVLLQPRQARQGQSAPPPVGNKVGWRDPAPYPARHREELKRFILLVTLGLQAPGLPEDEPGLAEAERLADEILRAPANTIPFNVRAQALAIKGRWTPALQTYIDGIRPLLPREYGNGLLYLILNHPRLKRPDSLRIPNPAQAEKHFAAGLNFYFDRDYANAEREFLLTVENDSQDARYFYFLGLSRLSQNRRRDAYADFEQGAELERVNRPAAAAVSESLERIQGPTRRIVNEIRNRPEPLPERR